METYAKYVRENPDLARRLPSLLPVIICLLPVQRRLSGSSAASDGTEVVAAEAGYALSRLWALLHDHLLHTGGEASSSESTTGLAAFAKASVETKAKALLTVICCTELLVEKWARQRYSGERPARRLIVLLEAMKLLLRLVILAKTEGGMLIHGGRHMLSAAADPDAEPLEGADKTTAISPQEDYKELLPNRRSGWDDLPPPVLPYVETRGRRTGRRFLTCRPEQHQQQEEVMVKGEEPGVVLSAEEEQQKPHPATPQEEEEEEEEEEKGATTANPQNAGEDGTAATQLSETVAADVPTVAESLLPSEPEEGTDAAGLVSSLSGEAVVGVVQEEEDERTRRLKRLRLAGEVLRLVRPLVQASWGGSSGEGAGSASWRPLLLSLLMDVVGLSFSAESMGDSSLARRKELERRRLLLLLYFLRPPVFQSTTDPLLSGVVSAASKLPLVGWMAGYLRSSVHYVQRYHFYTTGT